MNGRFVAKPNIFEVEGDTLKVYSFNKTLLFVADATMADLICRHNWFKLANGYAGTSIKGRPALAHRIIFGAHKGQMVDHVNRNKKDNHLNNLRLCDKSQNAFNCKIRKDNKSGVKGVWFRKDNQKWVAEIKQNNRKIVIGSFHTKEQATKARIEQEKILVKEFAYNAN